MEEKIGVDRPGVWFSNFIIITTILLFGMAIPATFLPFSYIGQISNSFFPIIIIVLLVFYSSMVMWFFLARYRLRYIVGSLIFPVGAFVKLFFEVSNLSQISNFVEFALYIVLLLYGIIFLRRKSTTIERSPLNISSVWMRTFTIFLSLAIIATFISLFFFRISNQGDYLGEEALLGGMVSPAGTALSLLMCSDGWIGPGTFSGYCSTGFLVLGNFIFALFLAIFFGLALKHHVKKVFEQQSFPNTSQPSQFFVYKHWKTIFVVVIVSSVIIFLLIEKKNNPPTIKLTSMAQLEPAVVTTYEPEVNQLLVSDYDNNKIIVTSFEKLGDARYGNRISEYNLETQTFSKILEYDELHSLIFKENRLAFVAFPRGGYHDGFIGLYDLNTKQEYRIPINKVGGISYPSAVDFSGDLIIWHDSSTDRLAYSPISEITLGPIPTLIEGSYVNSATIKTNGKQIAFTNKDSYHINGALDTVQVYDTVLKTKEIVTPPGKNQWLLNMYGNELLILDFAPSRYTSPQGLTTLSLYNLSSKEWKTIKADGNKIFSGQLNDKYITWMESANTKTREETDVFYDYEGEIFYQDRKSGVEYRITNDTKEDYNPDISGDVITWLKTKPNSSPKKSVIMFYKVK